MDLVVKHIRAFVVEAAGCQLDFNTLMWYSIDDRRA